METRKTEQANPIRTGRADGILGQGAERALHAGDQQATTESLPIPFRDCNIEEQIRRLHLETVMLRELVQTQQALLERLNVHSHTTGGEISIPVRYSGLIEHVAGMTLSGGRRRPDNLA